MTLGPDLLERLARARADLRIGIPVVLDGRDGRVVAAAAETLTPERLVAMKTLGPTVLAITDWRARTLKARIYDGDLTRVSIPAEAGVDWIRTVADPAEDMTAPMKGPFASERGDDATPHRLALKLVKDARLLPAAVVTRMPADFETGDPDLTVLGLDEIAALLPRPARLRPIISGRVPLAIGEAGRVHVFRPDDGGEEHYAVEIGRPDRSAQILVRLHSACFTGDVLGSLKCDCGPQLHGALDLIGAEGTGILLYLNQEGRGIGLANKMRAYALQDQGFDTVEANHRLGFEDDERDFRLGASILEALGIGQVRLITNNPAKIAMMEGCGITVAERVPLKVGRNPLNEKYLDVKAKKSGHIL